MMFSTKQNLLNDLCVGHVNVYHLVNKTHEIVTSLNCNQSIHILGVTETRLKHYHSNDIISIPDYSFIRQDAVFPGHAGIGVYIHNKVKPYISRRHDLELPELECIWLELRPHLKSPVLICFLYRNPSENSRWHDMFVSMMDNVNALNLNTVILGDFNINLLLTQQSWETTTNTLGLTQLISQPTRITNTSSTLIDHIYTNNPHVVYYARVDQTALSDHYPILCNLSFKMPRNKQKGHTYIQYRTFKHFNRDNFLFDLSQLNFDCVTNFFRPRGSSYSAT